MTRFEHPHGPDLPVGLDLEAAYLALMRAVARINAAQNMTPDAAQAAATAA